MIPGASSPGDQVPGIGSSISVENLTNPRRDLFRQVLTILCRHMSAVTQLPKNPGVWISSWAVLWALCNVSKVCTGMVSFDNAWRGAHIPFIGFVGVKMSAKSSWMNYSILSYPLVSLIWYTEPKRWRTLLQTKTLGKVTDLGTHKDKTGHDRIVYSRKSSLISYSILSYSVHPPRVDIWASLRPARPSNSRATGAVKITVEDHILT